MTTAQQGYLLIADISGYTMYLSESELDHAQEVLAALLELLIDHTRPPLAISRTAGDAVISYALAAGSLQGQTFVEMIEETYVAFRRAIDLMVMNNSCQCNACANINTLDLKFFVHYGAFAIQRLAGHDELVGSDVNLIHRLTKNHVVQLTGIRAYTLYSAVAIRQLGLEGFCEKLVSHAETYEHLGQVKLWVQDMHSLWQAKKNSLRIMIPPDQITLQAYTDIALPPHLVWDYLSQPAHRNVLMGATRQAIRDRKHGRIDEGSAFECYHGDRLTLQTIVQWRPFEQLTTEDLVALPGSYVRVPIDYRLDPTAHGTRLTQVFGKAKGNLYGRFLARVILGTMAKQAQRDIDAFKRRIEEDWARQDPSPRSG